MSKPGFKVTLTFGAKIPLEQSPFRRDDYIAQRHRVAEHRKWHKSMLEDEDAVASPLLDPVLYQMKRVEHDLHFELHARRLLIAVAHKNALHRKKADGAEIQAFSAAQGRFSLTNAALIRLIASDIREIMRLAKVQINPEKRANTFKALRDSIARLQLWGTGGVVAVNGGDLRLTL